MVMLVCFLLAGPSAYATERDTTYLDKAFTRLYNFDFTGAHNALDQYTDAHPDDPLGYAMRSSCWVFYELNRLGILEAEFFADDKKIADKKKLSPDPAVREKLFAAMHKARELAGEALKKDPNNTNALFAMCITYGVETDYTALVEKRQFKSLSTVKTSTSYAQRLLKTDPSFIDAHLSTGLAEYLIGSLPFFVRWFVRIDEIEGDKAVGVGKVALVAKSGRFLKPFAKVLLALVYMREKTPSKAAAQLKELSQDYPENPLFRRELQKISEGLRTGELRDR